MLPMTRQINEATLFMGCPKRKTNNNNKHSFHPLSVKFIDKTTKLHYYLLGLASQRGHTVSNGKLVISFDSTCHSNDK